MGREVEREDGECAHGITLGWGWRERGVMMRWVWGGGYLLFFFPACLFFLFFLLGCFWGGNAREGRDGEERELEGFFFVLVGFG